MRSRLKRSDFVVISGILWFAAGKEIVRAWLQSAPHSESPQTEHLGEAEQHAASEKQRQRMNERPP